MQYERITDKDLIKNININQNQDLTPMLVMIKRLWELENQIEKGEWVNTKEYYICTEKLLNHKKRFLICRDSARQGIYDFADTLEEAERRLNERNNGS